MNTTESPSAKRYLDSEELLRNLQINKMLVLSTIVATIAVVFAQFRALNIGWTYRDVLQLSALGIMIILTVNRHKITSRHKATFLIFTYILGGAPGILTLGMLAGTVFILPTASVIVALVYTKRTTLTFVVLSILLFCLVAVGFSSHMLNPPLSSDLMITSYSHWFVYIICVGFFFVVSCLTILDYRRTVGLLNAEVRDQRDELAKSNEDLREALSHVKRLSGLLPICSSCKKIRDDKGYWNQIESYIEKYSEADFSHSICPDCAKNLYPDLDIKD